MIKYGVLHVVTATMSHRMIGPQCDIVVREHETNKDICWKDTMQTDELQMKLLHFSAL